MNYDKKNVGIMGYWFATNYGGVASYYSLYQILQKYGYMPFLVENPYLQTDKEGVDVFSRNFFKIMNMRISDSYTRDELYKLNEFADTFILGSDQVLTTASIRAFGSLFLMDFVSEEKRKIACSVSCGGDNLNADEKLVAYAKNQLKNFQNVSVREFSAVDLVKKKFGIQTEMIADPIIMTSVEEYSRIGAQTAFFEKEDYLLAYVLDPTDDKRNLIQRMAKKLGLKIKVVLDGRKNTHEKNFQLMNMPEETLPELDFFQWISYFCHAKYIFTDSYHGTMMALILNKPFITYVNYKRGYPRFETIAKTFDIQARMVEKEADLKEDMLEIEIDFQKINVALEKQRLQVGNWLKAAMLSTEKVKTVEKVISDTTPPQEEDPDLERCRMLASLMRDYKIRHVVLPSGTRHVNLVRFFEQNDCFITHPVVDERSAGFFANGLALKLNETVAVCCTSGTASSNFLSPVTEAFYQNIPLLVITADRYPCLLGNQEQQMIPQQNMYRAVVKKSVSLPVNYDFLGKWETRRMICDSILEINHGGKGPVHINVPIKNIIRFEPSAETVKLGTYRNIFRIPYIPNRDAWKNSLEQLKKSHRIAIKWGQTNPYTSKESIEAVNEFAEHFDCVICTDHLSNMKCKKSVSIYNIPSNIKKNEVAYDDLAPDILITVHGNNLAEIGFSFAKSKNLEHWNVLPGGEISDHYRRLKKVFECTPLQFFKRMNAMAGDFKGGDSYYQKWLSYKPEPKALPEKYGQRYTVGSVIKGIPENSDLHLANSLTVRLACEFELKAGVSVYCNRGTNGIDGSASTFMGACAVSDKRNFLIIGDLSFFYDMNALWNKKLDGNVRIMLSNNGAAGLLEHHKAEAITYSHDAKAEGWVKSLGFRYMSATNKEEFDSQLEDFLNGESDRPIFFEVYTE